MIRLRRAAWPLIAGIALVALLFVGVFPTRTWVAQRRARDATVRRLTVLKAQSRALERRVARLSTDTEIERLAREEYNLVRPGEEAFAILPPAEAPPARGAAEPAPAPPPASR